MGDYFWEKVAIVVIQIILCFMIFLAFGLMVMLTIKFWGWLF